MADRAIDDDRALAAHAELDRGVNAASVEGLRRRPDPLDRGLGHPAGGRLVDGGRRRQRREIGRNLDPPQRIGDEREPGHADRGHDAGRYRPSAGASGASISR